MEPNDPKLSEQAIQLARAPRSIRDLIQSPEFSNAVMMALPKHVTKERFIRVALNAIMRKPELADCSKESFFLSMLELSALGIEPDGRRAHLIPFRSKFCTCNHTLDQHKGSACQVAGCRCPGKKQRVDVQLIVDYKGLAELVRRSGDVSYMHADVVHKADMFDFKYGSGAHLEHRPNLEVEDRGPIIAFYSFVRLRDGSDDFMVMPKSKVDAIRKRSKAASEGPWVTDYEEMGKKSVFRNHSKWLPLSPEVKTAIDHGDEFEGAIDAEGAITLASENTAPREAGEDDLDRKMREQSEAESKKEDPKPPSEKTEASQPKQESSQSETEMPANASINPPWPNKITMVTAFEVMKRNFADNEMFYQILGNHGVDANELELNAAHVKKAFAEVKKFIEERGEPEGSGKGPQPEFEFGPQTTKNRRNNRDGE